MTISANGRGNRGRRGVAMLELALLLPLYMLLFFIIWTMGDIGLVSMQAQLSARFIAWKRTPASHAQAKGLSGNLRAQTADKSETVYLMSLDGVPAPFTVTHWGQGQSGPRDLSAAASFPVYGNLERPMEGTGYAASVPAGSAAAERACGDVLGSHSGHVLGGTRTAVYGKYPVDARSYNTALFSAALEGDTHYAAPGVTRPKENIPWLRRHFALVELYMRGAAGITGYNTFVGRHTVLLGNGYQSSRPGYYAGEDKEKFALRNTTAWLYVPGGADDLGQKGVTNSHQLHFSPARKSLEPEF